MQSSFCCSWHLCSDCRYYTDNSCSPNISCRIYIHHPSLVHQADFHRESKEPWQRKCYSAMNYGTLAPQFINDNPSSEAGLEPCCSSSSSLYYGDVGLEKPGCTQGTQSCHAHYHVIMLILQCVVLNICTFTH